VRTVTGRVLIVDDDAAIADTLCEVLEMAGLEPLAALDGNAGLDAFARARPDLVVSDVMMPGLDGPALVRAIRATDGGRTVPIILMSAAHGLPSTADLPEHAAFFEKPFRVEAFLAQVERLLQHPSAA
jgi:DNA-binding response OmpR family regulator